MRGDKIQLAEKLHPSTVQILELFEYEHLPSHLQEISKKFHDLAWDLAQQPTDRPAELTVALRKLREAKDSAVTTALPTGLYEKPE